MPDAGAAGEALALDPLIHERMRLAIMSTLAVHEALSFNELKGLLDTTDGNLSVHARRLEAADYINGTKFYEGGARTIFRLTDEGRRALGHYFDQLEGLIRTTRGQ